MQNAFKTLISGILEVAKSYKGDWNESNSSSPNYIKNRTHWACVENVSILPSITLNSENFVLSSPLIEGTTYTVVFNGTEYKCVAKNYDGYIMIGNNAIYGWDNGDETDTGEPFAFECQEDNKEAWGYFADTITEAPTVSITCETEVIHKLDKKYIDFDQESIEKVVKEKFPGGVGYSMPGGEILNVTSTKGGTAFMVADTALISLGSRYYVNFNDFSGYLESYEYNDVPMLGDVDEFGFELYSADGYTYGEFDIPGQLIVSVDEILVKIDNKFINVPEGTITQDNIADNLPSNVVTIDEISKVATTGNYDDLKFKPCGIETTRTEFMNYEVTVNSTSTNKEAAEGYAFYRKMPEEGKMYEVICRRQSAYDNYEFYSYRGVMRKCPNPNDPNTYLNDLYIGNLWLDHPTYENTGEPFCMRFSPQSSNPQVSVYLLKNKIFSSGAAYDNYTLYEIEEGSIKALDERLLPYSYAKQDEVYTKEDVYTKEETYSTIDKTTTITWDGNADNRDKFTVAGVERKFCKVSEPIFLASESNFQSDDVVTVGDPLLLPTFNHSGDGIKIINGVAIVDAAGSYNIYFDPNSPGVSFTVTVPSPGIYFQGGRYTQVHVSSVTISSECRSLPEDVMGVVRTVNNITPDDNGNVNISIDGLSIKEYIDETIGGIENGTY